MKYEIPLYRTETKTIAVYADTPHEALEMALDGNPGFKADGLSELIEDPDEPGMEIGGEYFSWECQCESCDAFILTGDKYFQWGGDDAVATCEKCGGAGQSKPRDASTPLDDASC
jgi:hypothetical protein